MASRILTTLTALLASVLLMSVGLPAAASSWLWAAVIVVFVLAVVQPAAALLSVAAFAPLGGALAVVANAHGSWAEPLAMAAVTGWLLRRVVSRSPWRAWPATLAALYAIVVIASLGVQMYVTYDAIAPSGLTFVRAAFDWLLHTSSLPAEPGDLQIGAATRVLAGLGLFAMASDVCAASPQSVAGVARLMTLGVCAVAALNVNRFVELTIRGGDHVVATALDLQRHVRVSSTIPDLNAVSVLFVLALPLAIDLVRRARIRGLWVAATCLLVVGIWLSGSRAGMLGGVLAVAAYIALVVARRWTWQRTAVTLLLIAVPIVALAVWYPRADAHGTSADAWGSRKELVVAGLNMVRHRPAWGVGIGRFYPESARLGPPELKQYYAAENAHNQFIQVLGELGIAGAALFVGLVLGVLGPAARDVVRGQTDDLRAPLLVALTCFLGCSLLMHPLLIPEVSCAFWLALGLLQSLVPAGHDPRTRWRAAVAFAAGASIAIATVPARVAQERGSLELDAVGVGLSPWQRDQADGRRYRVATGAAAVYVDNRQQVVRLAFRARNMTPLSTTLHFRLNGQPAGTTLVESGQWRELTLRMPRRHDDPVFLRLDLEWTPPNAGALLEVGRPEYPALGPS